MAIVDEQTIFPITFSPSSSVSAPSFSTTSIVIDAANEQIEFIFRAPRTGTITKIGWCTRTVTTGATLDIRLETVSAGVASGTLKGTNTNVSQVVADGNDNVAFLCTLTAGASVVKGDKLALVIKNPSSSFGNIQIAGFTTLGPSNCPYTAQGGVRIANTPVFWVEYSDAPTHVPIVGVIPAMNTVTGTSVSTSSTPDVIGVRFQLPVSRRVKGAIFFTDLDGAANIRLVTTGYNQGTGTGIIATAQFDSEDDALAVGRGVTYGEFVENPTLDANTFYRLLIEPSSSTALTLYDFNVYDSNVMKCFATDWCFTTAKDPTGDGDWTNYNSSTFRIPFMWLVFDGIDIPVASSSISIECHNTQFVKNFGVIPY